MWDDAQRGLRDDAEHAFTAHHKTHEVKASFVFVTTAARVYDATVRQHHLQTEHVMPRDSVFEAARAARVHGDVATEAAFFE